MRFYQFCNEQIMNMYAQNIMAKLQKNRWFVRGCTDQTVLFIGLRRLTSLCLASSRKRTLPA
jgi:hypothetical protein